jgi:hypothetical protein
MDLIPIPYPIRFQHFYIPGGTGVGKTTQLLNFAVQDILNGCGITVIDPKGDLVNDLLNYIPESRIQDAIYLDIKTRIPFDFLSFHGDTEKDELVEDVIYLLLGDQYAPRAKGILSNVLYTILTSKEPISFLDITRFLTDHKRYVEIMDKLEDEELRELWKGGIPKDDKLEPIISRMTRYVRNSTLKVVFGTTKPELNLARVMNERKILLVNLGGGSRATLDYGSLLFMKLKQEVFRRHEIHPSKRIPHFLFVDEFQKFAHVDGFKDVLEMARSYKLAMTLANPSYHSLPENIKSGIGIIGSYILFALDPHDIPFFSHYYDFDDPDYLSKLPDRTAYYKIKSMTGIIKGSPPPPRLPEKSFAQEIKDTTFAQYGPKRPGDSGGCISQQVRHDVSNDKPEPQAGPRIPIDEGQGPRP